MKLYCMHHECRCHTAEELAFMAKRLHRPDLLAKAVDVHSQEVRCRHVPRKGPAINAPLPGGEST